MARDKRGHKVAGNPAPAQSADVNFGKSRPAVPDGAGDLLLSAMRMVGIARGQLVDVDRLDAAGACLERFFHDNPDTPAAAGVTQVRLALGIDMAQGSDLRVVELAVGLFKFAITGLDAIARADADADAARHNAEALAGLRRKPDPDELSFQQEDRGLDEPSDLARRR